MKTLKTDFNGNPNVGLFGYCTNEYCLLGKEVSEQDAEAVAETLGVPVHRVNICGTSLLGVFLAGNSKTLLVPEIAFDYELAALDDLGIKYTIVPANETAFGNNVLCNDKGCVVSEEIPESARKIMLNALEVNVKEGKIADLDIVGSLAAMNTKGGLIHRDIADDEKELVEEILGIEFAPTTLNMGSPFVSSGILCNDNGMVVGNASGGPELVEAEEGLGFLYDNN